MPGTPAPPPSLGPGAVTASASSSAILNVEFLVLDALPAAGLYPVVGTISGDYSIESQTSADVTWSLLSPSGDVVGHVLPTGTNRRYYHKDLLGSTRSTVIETGLHAESASYDP